MMRKKPGPQKPVKEPQPDDGLTQSERFIKAAQELGTDDDPERFKDRVRALARQRSEHEVDATAPPTKRR